MVCPEKLAGQLAKSYEKPYALKYQQLRNFTNNDRDLPHFQSKRREVFSNPDGEVEPHRAERFACGSRKHKKPIRQLI
jgi:hypothetical protein